MYVKEVRELIRDTYGDEVVFFGTDEGSGCYDNSIIGITDEGRLVYDSESIITELMNDNEWSEEDAWDWYGCNIVRSVPYAGPDGPILVNNTHMLYEEVEWLQEQRRNGNGSGNN